MKLDILAFGAHPDDVELSCSGTLIKHINAGKTAGIVDLTRGELGTRGNADIRRKEAEEAAAILGVSVRENLGFADGFFGNDKEHVIEIVKMIRRYMPDIVLCNAVEDRHPDHARASKLVSDACFYSGLIKLETADGGKSQSIWRPKAVYHYIQDRYQKPDFVIDITEEMEQRMKSVMAYKSQFYQPDSSGPQTPISSKEFLEYLYARASTFGRSINTAYAEGFTTERIAGVSSLFDLI